VPDESWFTAYHPYVNHMAFLLDLQQNFNNYAELFTTGNSFEGRPIIGIHIWGSGGKGSKPTVVIHGTVHAREWITTMTTEYFAYQMLNEYHHRFNATVRALVDKFDYYIIPIVNPDGTSSLPQLLSLHQVLIVRAIGFVHTQTTDRLWRKNRQPANNSSCIGRDINRNWPYKWDLALGSSSSPCSEIFKGEAAGDAPENLGLRTQIEALRDFTGVRLYLDIHAYGQFILWRSRSPSSPIIISVKRKNRLTLYNSIRILLHPPRRQ
jgi:murein tripeptide amidase MpaA